MGTGDVGPIEIPRLGDHVAASPDERGEHLMLLEAARNVLETEWIETLAVSDASEDHAVWGYTSTVAYIKDRCGISGSRANRYVKLAKAAQTFKGTLSSWKHRFINSDQAEMLFRASDRLPDKYPDAEPVLLEMVASDRHPDETEKTLEYWTATVDRDPLGLDSQLDRRHLDYSRRASGMSKETSHCLGSPARRSSPQSRPSCHHPPRVTSALPHDGGPTLSKTWPTPSWKAPRLPSLVARSLI